jgi:hypothetical protein
VEFPPDRSESYRSSRIFSDDRLKNWCIHCGGWLVNLDSNLDHAPSKSFLQDPRLENLPTVSGLQAL